jgi:hypothetical protein
LSGVDLSPEREHLLLGCIRLFTGTSGLLLTRLSARRLGVDPDANPAPIYPLRMFGVRTMILGAELLFGDEAARRRSARLGIAIHASDTTAAALGGLRGHLPPRVAIPLTAISTLNTTLAMLGSRPPRRRWLGRRIGALGRPRAGGTLRSLLS